MKNELDPKLVLRVFEKIRQHGTLEDDKYYLDGVYGTTDFDGYNVFLSDAVVELRFGFHNQYHFEYQHDEQREQFEKKLQHIDKNY